MNVRASLLRAEFQERIDARQAEALRNVVLERGFSAPAAPQSRSWDGKFDVTHEL
jgi:hypothetical protein